MHITALIPMPTGVPTVINARVKPKAVGIKADERAAVVKRQVRAEKELVEGHKKHLPAHQDEERQE
jgi:hypothetical protein